MSLLPPQPCWILSAYSSRNVVCDGGPVQHHHRGIYKTRCVSFSWPNLSCLAQYPLHNLVEPCLRWPSRTDIGPLLTASSCISSPFWTCLGDCLCCELSLFLLLFGPLLLLPVFLFSQPPSFTVMNSLAQPGVNVSLADPVQSPPSLRAASISSA